MRWTRSVPAIALLIAVLAWAAPASAARVSDVQATKHNLSAGSGNAVRVDSTDPANAAKADDQVCVFCHTPHAGTQGITPLWNRSLSNQTYTLYDSSSLDATTQQPGGSSKLCLSCHDGTLAIGQVGVLNGATGVTIDMQGTDGGVMPVGEGETTGFTRRIGTDLTNDHPVSFDYDQTLATTDGELYDPALNQSRIATRDHYDPDASKIKKPLLPLEEGQLQCTTCHDPHIRDTTGVNIKFLRANRFQSVQADGSFSVDDDQICLGCHKKEGWEISAHADQFVANEEYEDGPAAVRDFPAGAQVWQAGCLNCHDTHTVQGSRRLLREGVTGGVTGIYGVRVGGFGNTVEPATENTCYQCHSPDGGILKSVNLDVPDIATDFVTKTYHMPISKVGEQDLHDIGDLSGFTASEQSAIENPGANFIEGRTLLANRHAECTDCHNPHRVVKNSLADNTGTTTEGTHSHSNTNPQGMHTNIASGVLRGAWGVEPVYSSTDFNSASLPTFQIKQGVPVQTIVDGVGAGGIPTIDTSYSFVSREYQVCLKCHSNFAYGGSPPSLSGIDGGTAPGQNGLTEYTNQAVEFQAPETHMGENSSNHRSWHPVMRPTGRTYAERSMNEGQGFWLTPFDANVGKQTMYCSDCHGSETTGTNIAPTDPAPWGPHGSNNPFILKGEWGVKTGWKRGTGGYDNRDHLCFKCHSWDRYANPNASHSATESGFSRGGDNLHIRHAEKFQAYDGNRYEAPKGSYQQDKRSHFYCTLCHVAVPHGWKNKALLVNLNDVGPEAGLPAGTKVRTGPVGSELPWAGYTKEPYYLGAALKILNWRRSGLWDKEDCGAGTGEYGGDFEGVKKNGVDWMARGPEACWPLP